MIRFVPFYALLVFLSAFEAQSEPRKSIYWGLIDYAPFDGPDGIEKGYYGSLYRQDIQRLLPDYQHSYVTANVERFWSLIAEGQTLCLIGAYDKPDRRQVALFSEPDYLYMPISILMRAETLEKLGHPTSLSLSELLNDHPDLTLTIGLGRSYTQTLDEIIAPHRGRPHVIELTQTDAILEAQIGMLVSGRADYTLSYPDEARLGLQNAHTDGPLPRALEVREETEYLHSHVACTKGEWGAEIIRSVNAILPTLYRDPGYRGHYESWLDEGMRPTYRLVWDDRLLKSTN
ncbi:hypothetical protein JCM17960_16010 [Magnetospira thiophila]